MGLDKLLAEIERIGQVAGRWNQEGQIADIEREIVLDKLKHIYEEVMFLDRVCIEDTPAPAPEASCPVAPETSCATDSEASCPVVPKAPLSTDPEPAVSEKSTAVPEVAQSETSEPVLAGAEQTEAPVTTAPLQADGAQNKADNDSDEDGQAAVEPDAAAESFAEETVQVSVTVEEHSVEQKLFSDEPLVRSRVDKRVILSLYGDDTTSHHVSHTTHTQYQSTSSQLDQPSAEAPQPVVSADDSSGPVTPSGTTTVGNGSEGIPHKRVLGETLAQSGAAVNEVIGKQTAHADVASRLRSRGITDLRHSIGLNDRFLLIRDLFGGQADEYDRVIGELDRFTAFDDAMIYIQEHFDWNPDCDGATFLVELLERKLEQ